MLPAQPTATRAKGKNDKIMSQEVQLTWNAAGDSFENRQHVEFLYRPGHGLTDVDFHSITAREWNAMKAPAADTVARLQVTKETTIRQVEEVIGQIAEKGGYKTIVVSVGL